MRTILEVDQPLYIQSPTSISNHQTNKHKYCTYKKTQNTSGNQSYV